MNEVNIWATWGQMAQRLAVALPLWVLNRLDKRSEGKGFVVKAIPFVIMLLSLASIANLAGRAYIHHEDYSAYATGAGIAVLVPVAVIAAMLIDGWWAKLFWGMAFLFALVSGTIQYNIYLMPGGGIMSIAEAVAFGYGVPISEVMLAIMETRLVIQHENKKAAKERAAQEAAQAAEDAAKAAQLDAERKAEEERQRAIAEQRAEEERQRQAAIDAENREFERQRKQAELEAYRIELQQKAELDRERAMADLRIKEQKAAAKTAIKPATESATSQRPTERSQSTSRDDQMAMLTIYQSEPSLSDEKMATKIGKSKKTVQDLLADLAAKQVVHVERAGRGKTVTVNGKLTAFMAGELG